MMLDIYTFSVVALLVISGAVISYKFSQRSKNKNSLKQHKALKQYNKRLKLYPKLTLVENDDLGLAMQVRKKNIQGSSTFPAVSISHDMNACSAIKNLTKVRYLLREAPLIPLRDCSQSDQCACKYLHHKDRRISERRNSIHMNQDLLEYITEQRIEYRRGGRRVSDRA